MTTYVDTTLVGADAPVGSAIAVTPSDTVPLPFPSRALWIGSTGNISVVMAQGGNTVIFNGCATGQWMPLRVTQVNASSTTATSIVAVM